MSYIVYECARQRELRASKLVGIAQVLLKER